MSSTAPRVHDMLELDVPSCLTWLASLAAVDDVADADGAAGSASPPLRVNIPLWVAPRLGELPHKR